MRFIFLVLLLICISVNAEDRYFDSPYNSLILEKSDTLVTISRTENGGVVSAVNLENPKMQEMPYARSLFLAGKVMPDPANVLHIGLGLGAFNHLFVEAFPKAKLVSAEIDPMVVDLAEQHAFYKQSDFDRVIVQDGRRYIRRSKQQWDWIVVDAFVKNSMIPMHLTTQEFFQQTKDSMTENGVLVMNLHAGNSLFNAQMKTILSVFPDALFFGVPEQTNVIAVAPIKHSQNWYQKMLDQRIENSDVLLAGGVNLDLLARFIGNIDMEMLNNDTKLLTDDHAPVEFLGL